MDFVDQQAGQTLPQQEQDGVQQHVELLGGGGAAAAAGKQQLFLPQRSPLSVLDALGSPYGNASEAGLSPYPAVPAEGTASAASAAAGSEGIPALIDTAAACAERATDVSAAISAGPQSPAQPQKRLLPTNKCTTPPKRTVARRFFPEFGGGAASTAGVPSALPLTPGSGRTRQRSRLPRTGDSLHRINSLDDNKVLLATQLKRTESVVSPGLFKFSSHFNFLQLLGTSKYSEVYKVQHRQTGEMYAVKRCRRKFETRTDRERCLREIQAVAQLPAHPNIVGQVRAWQQEGHFYIQMDICEGGSLATLSQQYIASGQQMPEELLWQVLNDTAQGLAFLHANGILHLDIKPDNLYMDADGTFKIGDFGLAWLREQWDWEEGDGRYVAPELLRGPGETEPSSAADVYSLGAALYECATGHLLPRSIAERDAGQVLVPHRSGAFQWLLQQMLAPEPTARPLAADLVQQVHALHGPVCPSPALAQVFNSPSEDVQGAEVDLAAFLSPGRAGGAVPCSPLPAAGDRIQSPFASMAGTAFSGSNGGSDGTGCSLEEWAADLPSAPSLSLGALPSTGLSFGMATGSQPYTSRVASMMSLGSSRSSSMADLGDVDASPFAGFGIGGGSNVGMGGGICSSGGLSFGQRLDAVATGGVSWTTGLGADDIPAVQPSATPQCFGKRAGSSRRSLLPQPAPSFSFDAVQQPPHATSSPMGIPPPTPGTRLARGMSVCSLVDTYSSSAEDDSGTELEPVAPTRLFASASSIATTSGPAQRAGSGAICQVASFNMCNAD